MARRLGVFAHMGWESGLSRHAHLCLAVRVFGLRQDDLDVDAQVTQEPEQSIDGEFLILTVHQIRHGGLRHAKSLCRPRLAEATLLHRANNLAHQVSFEEFFLRIGESEIRKHVSAARRDRDFRVVLWLRHQVASLYSRMYCSWSCSARRRLFSMRSGSRRFVAMPRVDFFWKQCRTYTASENRIV